LGWRDQKLTKTQFLSWNLKMFFVYLTVHFMLTQGDKLPIILTENV